MKGFIEITTSGSVREESKSLHSLSDIISVFQLDDGKCVINFIKGDISIVPSETYKEIKELIKQATEL